MKPSRKFDVSLIRDKLVEHNVNFKLGHEVEYFDVTNPDHFVVMPEWFQELTTIPGVPFKFVAEFMGKPNSGKSTAGMEALISAQKNGVIAILVDAERKFSHKRFTAMGGDRSQLLVIQEKSIELTFDQLEKTIRTIHDTYEDAKILVVYDSIAVGVSQSEMEKSILDNQTVADQARAIKRAIRRQLYLIQDCQVAFIAINQVYSRVGSPGNQASGGQGLEYAKALSIQFQRTGNLYRQEKGVKYKYGVTTKVQAEKNHLMDGDQAVQDMILECNSKGLVKLSKKTKKKGDKTAEDGDLIAAEVDEQGNEVAE